MENEKLYEIAKEPKLIKSKEIYTLYDVEAVVEANPQFKDFSITQLGHNVDFMQKLEEYRLNNPSNAEAIEILKSVIPKKHVKPNNKLANKITKDIVDDGEFNLIVSGNKAKKEVTTKIMLNYESENVHMSSRIKYTPYDREVYDGVVTLYAAGNNIVTPIMVYRAMNGLTETEYVSPQAIEEVRKSLDKSRHIKTTIDYTDEAKMYNKNIEKTAYEGYLLEARKITVKINREEHEAYKLLDKPILYEYAQISKQIISVPLNLLNTKNKVNSTEDIIIIRGYLIRQIEWLKNAKTYRSDNIAYQPIYEELGISKITLDGTAYKNKTRTIRNHVKSILESWKLSKYIQDYEEYKENKALAGITIKV
jgi:hypothetical protein